MSQDDFVSKIESYVVENGMSSLVASRLFTESVFRLLNMVAEKDEKELVEVQWQGRTNFYSTVTSPQA